MPPATGETSQVRGRWLPEEIQAEILSRLPTPASIARFRCVSKLWRRLLSDENPEFIAKILFSDDDVKGSEARVMTLSSLFTHYTITSYNTLRPVSSGKLPGSDTAPSLSTAGCSGGIFCLFDWCVRKEIILWNPTTSETKLISPPTLPAGLDGPSVKEVGFGFDPVAEDYKVLVWLYNYDSPHIIYVYSLRKNTWRKLNDCVSAGFRSEPGHRVGLVASREPKFSRCHWIATDFPEYFLLTTFDMSKEAFTQLRLPVLPIERQREASFHMVKDGSCLVAVYSGLQMTRTKSRVFLKVWAALDYEALARKECSWIRLYNLISRGAPHSSSVVWEHGRFFVRWSTDAMSGGNFERTENGVVDHKFQFNYRCLERVSYVPSTISLASDFGDVPSTISLESDHHHLRGRKKSLMQRVRDACRRSICRTV